MRVYRCEDQQDDDSTHGDSRDGPRGQDGALAI